MRYSVIGQKLKVDPHYIRFPRVASLKMLLPKSSRMTFANGISMAFQENIMMLGGASLKKSTILRMLRRILQEELRPLLRRAGLHQIAVEACRGQGSDQQASGHEVAADRPEYEEHPELPSWP